jgi:hypothetical protein
MAGATLFSDLGPPGNLYQCCIGWTVAGSGTLGTSFTAANLFTVSGSGNFNVTQIDLGTNYITGTNTFYASIWTDSSGVPGSQVAGAYWGSLVAVACCGLVTIPVSGVSLTGGQSYFMVLGPMNLIDQILPLQVSNAPIFADSVPDALFEDRMIEVSCFSERLGRHHKAILGMNYAG